MTSSLKHHHDLKHFIKVDEKIPVWHRVYAFHDKAIHHPTLHHHLRQTAGLHLAAETNQDESRGKVTPEKLHGFISTCKITPHTDGVCTWCQEVVKAGISHICAIITLYANHVEETQEAHDKLEKALQEYHAKL